MANRRRDGDLRTASNAALRTGFLFFSLLLPVLLVAILTGLTATGQSASPWSDVRIEISTDVCQTALIRQDQLDPSAWFVACSNGFGFWRTDTQNITFFFNSSITEQGANQMQSLVQDPFDGRLFALLADTSVYRLSRTGTDIALVVPPSFCRGFLQQMVWSPLSRRLIVGCGDQKTFAQLVEIDVDARVPVETARLLLDLAPSRAAFSFTLSADYTEVLATTTTDPTVYSINATYALSNATAILRVNTSTSTHRVLAGALRLDGAHRDTLVTLEFDDPSLDPSAAQLVAYTCGPDGVPLSDAQARLVLYAGNQAAITQFVWDAASLSLLFNMGGQLISLQWLASTTTPRTVTSTNLFLLNGQDPSISDILVARPTTPPTTTSGDPSTVLGSVYWVATGIGVLSFRGESVTTLASGRDCPAADAIIYDSQSFTLFSGCTGSAALISIEGGQNVVPLVSSVVCANLDDLALDASDNLYISCYQGRSTVTASILLLAGASSPQPTLSYLATVNTSCSLLFADGVLFVVPYVGQSGVAPLYFWTPAGGLQTVGGASSCTQLVGSVVVLGGDVYFFCSPVLPMPSSLMSVSMSNLASGAATTLLTSSAACQLSDPIEVDPQRRLLYLVCNSVRIGVYHVDSQSLTYLSPPTLIAEYLSKMRLDVAQNLLYVSIEEPVQHEYVGYLDLVDSVSGQPVWAQLPPICGQGHMQQFTVDQITGTVYASCRSANTFQPTGQQLAAYHSRFRCPPGFAWVDFGCSPCTPATQSGVVSSTVGTTTYPQCQTCGSGLVAPVQGSPLCTACPAGSFAESNGQSCSTCSIGTISNASATTCQACPIGTEAPFPGSTTCAECPLGLFSPAGTVCSECGVDTYTPAAGLPCASCTGDDQEGLVCSNGIAQVSAGWWAYGVDMTIRVSPSKNATVRVSIFRTTRCPDDFCLGSILQGRPANDTIDSAYSLCRYPRLDSPDNWVCAHCVDGHIPWGKFCVPCTGANVGLISLILLGCFALVLFLLYSGASAAGQLTIALFFIQTAALEVGDLSSVIAWLQWANLSTSSTRGCIALLTPLQRLLITFLSPVILAGCLLVIGVVHSLLPRCIKTTPASSSRLRSLVSSFSLDRYIGCLGSIGLFAYTPVAIAVVQALHCIEIAPGMAVLFALPSVDCDSAEYLRFRLVAILVLVFVVIGFPLVILAFLFRRRRRLAFIPSRQEDLHTVLLASASSPASDAGVDDSAADAADPEEKKLSPFELRWGPFFRGYRTSAFFWQPLLLLRRFGFALVSVLLADTQSRFSIYVALLLTSMLVHVRLQPFLSNRLNRIETISYVLLMYLSTALASSLPPFSIPFEILLFCLTVPPALLLLVWTARHHLRLLKSRRLVSESSSTFADSRASEHSVAPGPVRFHPRHIHHPVQAKADELHGARRRDDDPPGGDARGPPPHPFGSAAAHPPRITSSFALSSSPASPATSS